MVKLICKLLIKLCEKTGRVLYITGTGGDNDIYLIRYYIVRSKRFNIYLHRFLRSDIDDLHDHPWNFWTYIVSGQYWERLDSNSKFSHNFRSNKTHRFVARKATDLHRVELDRAYTLEDKDEAPLTIFISGAKKRRWGFVKDGKWIHWKEYLGLPDNAQDRG